MFWSWLDEALIFCSKPKRRFYFWTSVKSVLSELVPMDPVLVLPASLQRHAAAELCRFCEGFFLQNLDRLLDREDFHWLLLGNTSKGGPSGSGRDQNLDLLPVLRSLEAVLIHRLSELHAACRGQKFWPDGPDRLWLVPQTNIWFYFSHLHFIWSRFWSVKYLQQKNPVKPPTVL